MENTQNGPAAMELCERPWVACRRRRSLSLGGWLSWAGLGWVWAGWAGYFSWKRK